MELREAKIKLLRGALDLISESRLRYTCMALDHVYLEASSHRYGDGDPTGVWMEAYTSLIDYIQGAIAPHVTYPAWLAEVWGAKLSAAQEREARINWITALINGLEVQQ